MVFPDVDWDTLEFRLDSTVLDTFVASPNPPTLQLTGPSLGDIVTGDLPFNLSVTDPDSDRVTYSIEFSSDGGTTWSTVAAGSAGALSESIDREVLESTSSGLLRVVASDGTSTVTTTSALFTVINSAPVIDVVSPEPGAQLERGTAQLFSAVVTDPDVEAISVEWAVAGQVIASGDEAVIEVDGLPAGTTGITITATDETGAQDTATIPVTVIDSQTPADLDPTISIVDPDTAVSIEVDLDLTLIARYDDAEDGLGLPDPTWTSDLDGPLGSGSEFTALAGSLTPGNHVITVAIVDSAGNTASATVDVVVVAPDVAGPTITPTATPEPNLAGWNNGPVTISFDCADPAGVASCPNPVEFSQEGSSQQSTVTAIDDGGNESNLVVTASIDVTAPDVAITGAVEGQQFPAGTSPTVACDAADGLSGLAVCDLSFATTQLADAVEYTYTAIAIDLAGNTAAAGPLVFAIADVPTTGSVCDGLTPTIEGTEGSETINGTSGDDIIFAYGGNDKINGKGGNDIVCAGPGNDTINLQDGDDVVDTGPGNDKVNAKDGDNTVYALEGNNTVNGGIGVDIVYAGPGNDIINSKGGDDVIDAGDGDNRISASNGNDTVVTGAGIDILNLGSGDDTGSAGPGDDLINAGSGVDIADGGDGTDTCFGEETAVSCEL